MARRMAGRMFREQKSSGQEEEKKVSLSAVPVSVPISSDSSSVLLCPVHKCEGRLTGEASDYDVDSGLERLVCAACGHHGYRSRDGVMLLFRGGYEYKFSYGPSVQTITVLLSSASVNLLGTHGVQEDQLAKLAAEWSLLCGRKNQPVHLGIPAKEFADFYLYFCKG